MILVSCCNGYGGLFVIDEQSHDLAKYRIAKLVDSEMRGIDYYNDVLYSCDHEGINAWKLDLDNLSASLLYRREHVAEWHGLRVHDGRVYVVDSPGDEIHVFDLQLNPIDGSICFQKHDNDKSTRMHVNDLCFDSNGDLLFSSFSVCPLATYTKGEGSIRRIRGNEIEILEYRLRHPHSIITHNGSRWWCDSSNDCVMTRQRDGQVKSFAVVGYPRGLVIAGKYIYVGISEDRHDGQKKGKAGVVRVTRKNPSEQVPIPLDVKEVYGLVRI